MVIIAVSQDSNHSYDLGKEGVVNKIEQLEKRGADYIGTRKSAGDSLHKVVDIKGIKVGMLNYAREAGNSRRIRKVLNNTEDRITGQKHAVVVDPSGGALIAAYKDRLLDAFFGTLKKDIDDLRKQGADIIAAYPHWGTEYQLEPNEYQEKLAQKMCDLGVDVIIGGHPHVVQPSKIYTSSVSGKTTICLHSMGNFVSSMRVSHEQKDNSEYTEDGVLFKYTVKKYDDGTAAVTHAGILPVWVKRTVCDERTEYVVIPLDKNVDWMESFGVYNYSSQTSSAFQSRKRTRGLAAEEINRFNALHKKINKTGTLWRCPEKGHLFLCGCGKIVE